MNQITIDYRVSSMCHWTNLPSEYLNHAKPQHHSRNSKEHVNPIKPRTDNNLLSISASDANEGEDKISDNPHNQQPPTCTWLESEKVKRLNVGKDEKDKIVGRQE